MFSTFAEDLSEVLVDEVVVRMLLVDARMAEQRGCASIIGVPRLFMWTALFHFKIMTRGRARGREKKEGKNAKTTLMLSSCIRRT